jgi:hypothetical protein
LYGLLQRVDKSLPACVIVHDVLPGIAARYDVVDRISALNSQAASHGSIEPRP